MITRRNLFRASLASGIALAVDASATVEAPADVLTFADLQRAAAMLRSQNVPVFGGQYRMFLHPIQREEITLDGITAKATYRARATAWSLMLHERRRQAMGKRGHVTAEEVARRVGINVKTISPSNADRIRGVRLETIVVDNDADFETG